MVKLLHGALSRRAGFEDRLEYQHLDYSKPTYFRVVNKIRGLRHTWTSYELLIHNCNDFVSEIATSLAPRTPVVTAQYFFKKTTF